MTSIQDLLAFIVSGEKSGVIVIGQPLCYLTLLPYFFQYSAFVLCIWCFCYYVMRGISFLIPSVWCSVGFLYIYMGISFFSLGKSYSIILLKMFTGPLSWESLLSSILIILRLGLLIVSWISWMFWVRTFLLFAFSLTIVSMFCSLKFFAAWMVVYKPCFLKLLGDVDGAWINCLTYLT
jgi:hypothetical protein